MKYTHQWVKCGTRLMQAVRSLYIIEDLKFRKQLATTTTGMPGYFLFPHRRNGTEEN